jgi:Survival protein SurE
MSDSGWGRSRPLQSIAHTMAQQCVSSTAGITSSVSAVGSQVECSSVCPGRASKLRVQIYLTRADPGGRPFLLLLAVVPPMLLAALRRMHGTARVSSRLSARLVTALRCQVHRKAEDDYHIEASPASCVNLALYDLASDADLVIAGPNVGHNAGRCAATAEMLTAPLQFAFSRACNLIPCTLRSWSVSLQGLCPVFRHSWRGDGGGYCWAESHCHLVPILQRLGQLDRGPGSDGSARGRGSQQ